MAEHRRSVAVPVGRHPPSVEARDRATPNPPPSAVPDSQHVGRSRVAMAVGRRLGRAALVVAFPALSPACSVNADPAVHPPRGLAMPPPAALLAPPGPVPATAPVLAQAGEAADAAPHAVPAGRRRR